MSVIIRYIDFIESRTAKKPKIECCSRLETGSGLTCRFLTFRHLMSDHKKKAKQNKNNTKNDLVGSS